MAGESRIKVYGTAYCSFCMAARMLLKKKGLEFEEISVDHDQSLRKEMETLSGRRSVPQIFLDGEPLGGFDELYMLERSGEFDRLLDGAGIQIKNPNTQETNNG